MAVTFQTPQTPVQTIQRPYQTHLSGTPHSTLQNHHPPVSASQMLDMYYTSLCQPAFPEPGKIYFAWLAFYLCLQKHEEKVISTWRRWFPSF